MSEYRLDITGGVELSDYSSISDYMELVDIDDKFTITLDTLNSENIDLICSMLEDKSFRITSKGNQTNGKVYISALRKRQQ